MNTHDQVRDAVARLAHKSAQAVGDDARLAEDLGIRSVGRIELALSLEESLGRPVSDATVMKAKTVRDLVAALGA